MAKAKVAKQAKAPVKKTTAKTAHKAPVIDPRLIAVEEQVYQATLNKILNFLDKHEIKKEKLVSKLVEKIERDAAKEFAALFDDNAKKSKKKSKKSAKAKKATNAAVPAAAAPIL